jgi:hypothetical protein
MLLAACTFAPPSLPGAQCDATHPCDVSSPAECRCGRCVAKDGDAGVLWSQAGHTIVTIGDAGFSPVPGGSKGTITSADDRVYVEANTVPPAAQGLARGSFQLVTLPARAEVTVLRFVQDPSMPGFGIELTERGIPGITAEGGALRAAEIRQGGTTMLALNAVHPFELGWKRDELLYLQVDGRDEVCVPLDGGAHIDLRQARLGIVSVTVDGGTSNPFSLAFANWQFLADPFRSP